MSKKRYVEGRNQALEQIIKEQQKQLETKDFIIDVHERQNDQAVLACKFLVDILMLTGTLENVLVDSNVLSEAIKLAVSKFKVELSQAMQTIQYDGGNSYTYALNTNNIDKNWNDEEE